MPELLADLGLEIAVMAAMWGLALAFPFRRFAAAPETRWDLVAVTFAFPFALIAGSLLTPAFDTAAEYASDWLEFVRAWPTPALALGYVLFADFSSYWAHRLLHTRGFWHTHAFHHSSQNLYVLSGLRSSFIHVVLLFAGPLAGLVIFPLYDTPLVLAAIGASQVANQHYTHSNIRLPFSDRIERVFVTPRYHFVHHSIERTLSNSNYGFLLTVWDRLFGTFTDPQTVRADEPMGLDYGNSKWRMLVGLAPKRGAWQNAK